MSLKRERERERWMREEIEDGDRQLIESLDEREWCRREWGTHEANKRDKLMLHQMFRMVNDSRHGPDNPSSSHPNRIDPPT